MNISVEQRRARLLKKREARKVIEISINLILLSLTLVAVYAISRSDLNFLVNKTFSNGVLLFGSIVVSTILTAKVLKPLV